ncbi:amino acid ABC transporter permease [Pelagibacteraceae bacterium]|jgi:general L-amino acid transport system permease protein|nr:amino acid ABC transporter permease [Pelagibacteraceae bacterium]MDB9743549.1 amino acid ABC transporter permease [Pelagibacteraceae bacterium]MDC0339770.1 amino acid ABC transporter permease [Pelagibacteraceae bacterium]MDC0366615.1 amino acid ABC transporter permease [Pelagibacteraceae bacterium]
MNIKIMKPNKENLTNYVTLGSVFIFIALFDLLTNSFLNWNFTDFLPDKFSYFTPFIFGILGLYLIRIEFSGNKLLDTINANFNSSNFNAILTLLITFALIKFIPPLLNWFIFDANFLGNTKDDCTGGGACWVFVKVWLNRFVYGMYPDAEQWRINTAFIILFTAVGASFFASIKYKRYLIIFLLFIYPIIGFKLISGGDFGLKYVETGAWGGLSLTFIVSAFSLILCFPVGMLLALGRRSSLPAIKYTSIGFIELWRGVPLITVLFMSAVMFPMFLPDGTYVDKLIRVLIAITLFEAAYMAEVIRGGLQALPKGQYEAAKSLGMGYWRMHFLIILPQALKLVIPGIANTFLALVKDTPLIFVVGLLELAGMVNLAKTNPKWLGMAMEGYVFAGLVFWVICYSMSRYSQNLEKKLSTER